MVEARVTVTWAVAACVASLVLACSGGAQPAPDGAGASGGDPAQPVAAGGESSGGADGGGPGTLGGGGHGSGGGDASAPACATTTAQAEAQPVSLVFMYDRSDSMVGTKWTSTSQGIDAFFADPKSKGTSASLAFFCGNSCAASSYQTPSVALSALPDTQSFAQAIQAQQLCNGTPTAGALQGALAYAQTVKQQQPTGNVVVVLITDGQPTTCGGLQGAVSAATTGAGAGFKTYVIGVGSSLKNLDALAAAGGTGKAILVDTTNPPKLVTDFEKAIDAIRVSAMSCEFGIPAANDGGVLDVNKVNVTITQGGSTTTLSYDAQCAGAGWRYDDVNAPTKVELCPVTCDAAKNDASSKVDLVFGCATQGGTPK